LLYGLNLFVDLQLRRVDYEFLGIDKNLENVQQSDQLNFFNPKAGLFYDLNSNTAFYTSFGIASREPNRNDYTENPNYAWPKPERLYNTEAGFRKKWKKAALDVNLYHMQYKDQLVLNGQINDVGEYMRINVDKSYRLGLELSGGLELAPGLHFNANTTVSQNKVKSFTEYVDVYDANFDWIEQQAIKHTDTDLAFSPSLITAGELSYQLLGRPSQKEGHKLVLSLLAKHISKQYIDNTSDEANVIDPYTFSDFRINYSWNPKWMGEIGLNFMVNNIFDSQFESNAWSYRYVYDGTTEIQQGFYPQAGINFLAGLQLKFFKE